MALLLIFLTDACVCVCVFFLLSQILLFCLAAEKQIMSAKINDLALQATKVMARAVPQAGDVYNGSLGAPSLAKPV